MTWEVEFTDEFEAWWGTLDPSEQDSVDVAVRLLEEQGPHLAYPYSSRVFGSRHPNMRELRIQHRGKPYRVLYAFDPRRVAILLLGAAKTGTPRWYASHIPKADALYYIHLRQIETEE